MIAAGPSGRPARRMARRAPRQARKLGVRQREPIEPPGDQADGTEVAPAVLAEGSAGWCPGRGTHQRMPNAQAGPANSADIGQMIAPRGSARYRFHQPLLSEAKYRRLSGDHAGCTIDPDRRRRPDLSSPHRRQFRQTTTGCRPRHVRMIPRQPREPPAVGAEPGSELKSWPSIRMAGSSPPDSTATMALIGSRRGAVVFANREHPSAARSSSMSA